MIKSILFPHSHVWHFGDEITTTCGRYVKGSGAIIRKRPASDGKICVKCTRWVGDHMMLEYLGTDWLDEPTMAELRKSEVNQA